MQRYTLFFLRNTTEECHGGIRFCQCLSLGEKLVHEGFSSVHLHAHDFTAGATPVSKPAKSCLSRGNSFGQTVVSLSKRSEDRGGEKELTSKMIVSEHF